MATILAGISRNWIVFFLIGLLLGSIVTAAYAYSDLSGLVSEQTVEDLFGSLDGELKKIEEKLDTNLIDLEGTYIAKFNELTKTVDGIKSEVDRIERKLDVNGINESMDMLNYLDGWFRNLNKSIHSINATVVLVHQIKIINNNIQHILNNITLIHNTLNNLTVNINTVINNIDIMINSLTFIQNEIVNVLEVQINEIYTFITVDIYQSLQSISVQITNIQNTLNSIYVSITQINFLVQKRVIIETIPRSEYSGPYHHEFFVQVSVQGDGSVPESGIIGILVYNAEASYTVTPTGIPGLFIVSIDLPNTTPTGQYVVVIDAYSTITLPDGSTRTYNGTTIESLYVY